MNIRAALVIVFLLTSASASAETTIHRRALLIGICDYSASHLPAPSRPVSISRDWPDLLGPVNDVRAMADMLVLLYGFDRADIVTLTDQNATRDAILQAIETHLVAPAAKGDIVFFYFGGHGSQVRNTLSDEPDKLDESIVPADSRNGAADIRDKELRRLFNRILDRRAHLTVMLDNCHSGSGARGLPTGAIARGLKADLRDVADATNAGPAPETRGALVLSASEDADSAWETRDDQKHFHGVFSWAWLRAMRDSIPGEAAMETFLRAQARMRGETPFQSPVIAGSTDARMNPFLGVRTDRHRDRAIVAVESVQPDGTVRLEGGWANGLSVGTELRVAKTSGSADRLRVENMIGLGRCEARMENGAAVPPELEPGALLEVSGWYSPRATPLRVWMPAVSSNIKEIAKTARELWLTAAQQGIRWVTDPVNVTPTHTLRHTGEQWELLARDGMIERLGGNAGAIAAVSHMPAGTSLFVQFPVPATLGERIGIGRGAEHETIEQVNRPQDADYILAGRFSSRHVMYGWVRPLVKRSDRRACGLPPRTAWIATDRKDSSMRQIAATLHDSVVRLRRIQMWTLLESPPSAGSPYRLALRRMSDDRLVHDPVVTGGTKYQLVLRQIPGAPAAQVKPRYFYVFAIDSFGRSVLLYPRTGSVENRFPLNPDDPPAEIALGAAAAFEASPPYGTDTYFILSTDEPLPNPWIVEWDGVRTRQPESPTPLEELLMLDDSRGTYLTPPNWSIERVVYESVPARKTTSRHKR